MAEGTSRPTSMRGGGNEISSDASRYQSLGSRPIPPPKNPSLHSSYQPSPSQRRGGGTGPGARSALHQQATPQVPPKPKRHLPRKVISAVIGDHSITGAVSCASEEVPSCKKKSSPKQGITKQKKGIHGHKNNSFVEVCNVICDLVKTIHTKHEQCVSKELKQMVKRTKRILKGNEVCISVLGLHNTGKSTILNALLGDYFLPVRDINETSVKVKIQHDSSIHMGVCPEHCEERDSRCCPQLLIVSSKGKKSPKTIFGPHKIDQYLQQLNVNVRNEEVPPGNYMLTLKVNIPMFCESVPPGWTVSIIDNPGFGETEEQITQLAEASMVTSCAYIYLLPTENIGGRDAAEFFRELKRIDEGALIDGRLTIGITKFDRSYSSLSSGKKGAVTAVEAKDSITRSIRKAIDVHMIGSDDMIIPLCGEWALASSRLASCLIWDQKGEIEARQREAACALRGHPDPSLPCGQGQKPHEAVMKHPPIRIIQEIDTISGIFELRARISHLGKVCAKAWSSKLHAAFQHSILRDLTESLENAEKETENLHQTKQEALTCFRSLLGKICQKKKNIKANIVNGRNRDSTEAWKSFENSYTKDITTSEPQVFGKETAKTLIIKYRDACKAKIENREFGPSQFGDSLKDFLHESALQLQKVFDGACGFQFSNECMTDEVERVISEISSMKELAIELRSTTSCNYSITKESAAAAGLNRSQRKRNVLRNPPNLGEIKQKVSIPEITLPWWKIIMQFFRGLFSGTDLEVDIMPGTVNPGLVANCSSSSPPEKINSIVRPFQPTLSKDEPDLYDECLGPLLCSIDDADKHRTVKPPLGSVYKSWTAELEETLKKVLTYMEEECDKYFRIIEHKAIKYFYEEYCQKTLCYLKEFDSKFGEVLKLKKEEIDELKKETKELQETLEELAEFKKKLGILAEQLIDEYESFTTEHCGEFKQFIEDQPPQDRMTWYSEQIELAKTKNDAIRMYAHLNELDTY